MAAPIHNSRTPPTPTPTPIPIAFEPPLEGLLEDKVEGPPPAEVGVRLGAADGTAVLGAADGTAVATCTMELLFKALLAKLAVATELTEAEDNVPDTADPKLTTRAEDICFQIVPLLMAVINLPTTSGAT